MSTTCCPVASRFARLFVITSALTLTSFAAVGDDAAKPKEPTGSADPAKLPGPRAEYAPEQVVQIVMDALQNNDSRDSGIVTAFNFASPDNKQVTGPVARFIPMVKTPGYLPMLNFKSADFGEVAFADEQTTAQQNVTVITRDGEVATYLFRLSKQTDGEFKDCWMTDAVVRVQPKGKQA